MQNHEEPDAEPGAACRTPFCWLDSLLIWGSIGWPLKCKLMGFFGHMLLSRAPPPCVVLCQGPKVNFPGHPRVTKLFCIGSPLNRSRSLTYCIFSVKYIVDNVKIHLQTRDWGKWPHGLVQEIKPENLLALEEPLRPSSSKNWRFHFCSFSF